MENLRKKPVIYALMIYFLWELIGFAMALLLNKILPEVLLDNQYCYMFLSEFLIFAVMYFLFCRKTDGIAKTGEKLNIIYLIPAGIQIADDIAVIMNGTIKMDLLTGRGIFNLLLCLIGTLSIGLLEETVWRYLIFGNMVTVWKDRKYGTGLAVFVSSLFFGLCHYMNMLTGGQELIPTSIQVLMAFCMGVFLAAVYYRTGNIAVPIFIHGILNFSNFFMNEILGYDYEVLKQDALFQAAYTILYLIFGILLIYRKMRSIV